MLIVVRAPRHKLAFLFALSAVMVAGSAWLIAGTGLWPLTLLPGGLGILFFGVCGGWILSRLFSHRISLVLDRGGLLDNSSAIPAGRIPWDQIARVGITAVNEQRFLGIDVKDRSVLVSSTSAFRRWMDDANTRITGFPVNVPSATIDRPLEELEAMILRYWKHPETRSELGEPTSLKW